MTLLHQFYLDGASHEPAFVTFHDPPAAARLPVAVLFCPPFGWEEISSYRSLRDWAQELAAQGYPTLRLSFPGTGDSGAGPRTPGRLDAWTASVTSAANWVLGQPGVSRVATIGIGLGGLIALRASGQGAPIEELVLWAAPPSGQAFVRQFRAFSRMEVSTFFEGLPQPPSLPAGELEAGGFLLSAETVAALTGQLDTNVLSAPKYIRRMLGIERDGIPVEPRLIEHARAAGVAIELSPGKGYGSMTAHPQQAQRPTEVIRKVAEWLAEGQAPTNPAEGDPTHPISAKEATRGGSPDTFCEHDQISIAAEGGKATETPLTFEAEGLTLSAVLSEPTRPIDESPCVIMLNAGAVRRVGPSRMWTEAARRWAGWGVTTLRLDVEGIGDSDGDPDPYRVDDGLYTSDLVKQVIAAVDFMQLHRGTQRFVLGGLCAGAYWSLHAALQDDRVCGLMMVNPRAVIWDTDLGPTRYVRMFVHEPLAFDKIRRSWSWRRLFEIVTWLTLRPINSLRRCWGRYSPDRADDTVDQALERLSHRGTHTLMLFSDREPLYDELARAGWIEKFARSDSVHVERIAVKDHTLRPNWAQTRAHEALDRVLREILRNQVPASTGERAHQAN